jgi:hypothetical protein
LMLKRITIWTPSHVTSVRSSNIPSVTTVLHYRVRRSWQSHVCPSSNISA